MILINSTAPKTLFLISLALVLCVLVVTAGADSSGVVDNGGFEIKNEKSGGPQGWSTTQVKKTNDFVTFTWEEGVSHSGTRSVSIAVGKSHPDDQVDYSWHQAVQGYNPGQAYELAGWVKTDGLKGAAFIVIQCWDGAFKEMLDYATTQWDYELTGTTDWTEINVPVNIPAGTGKVMILAGIRGPDNRGGKVWFDDIQVIRLSDAVNE